jgi:hypothetical protein
MTTAGKSQQTIGMRIHGKYEAAYVPAISNSPNLWDLKK